MSVESSVDLSPFDDVNMFFRDQKPDAEWRQNNNVLVNYSGFLFDDYDELLSRIEGQIGRDSQNTGLDIAGGADGVALQDLLDDGVIGKGLVTNLTDMRSKNTRGRQDLGHVEGDISDRETWQRIVDWQTEQAPRGFSVILHRPFGGIQEHPESFYQVGVHTVLDLLEPEGLAILQVPWALLFGRFSVLSSMGKSIKDRSDVVGLEYTRMSDSRASCVIYKAP